MSPRPYRSPRRAAAATKTRARLLAAAAAILGAPAGIGGFSLEEVARKAGVTRLTVYNRFGSRRALLEAVFDERAARGGLHRLAEAMAASDPHAGLLQVIAIFCDFWSYDPRALGRLHAAGASDPEFDASVRERNERRRSLLLALVGRMAVGLSPPRDAVHDLVDVLFALTSYPFFSQLTAGRRTADAACRLIQGLAMEAVRRMMERSS
ncbi:MAG TPA: TetR/AcrR family transcriptional regulator [Steroidobacteraceae bacterium]|jgi:AcrR family transcriptional regulator|nr:TetR/AcrR family transcriptional regulator [Steroidobacteraceae bacterium]